MLKFFGVGSAFNTVKGNNSAYYKWDDNILIIDCGSNIFHRIIESGELEGVNNIHVIITHTHADHVGSLGDLVLYSYFSHNTLAEKCLTVYSPADTKVPELLHLNGCIEGEHYDYRESTFGNDFDEDIDFFFVKSTHVNEIPSYSLHLILEDKEIFYSGDISVLPLHVRKWIHDGRFEQYYIDTSGLHYEGNVHLSFKELCHIINQDVRHKVWCMHLDKAFDETKAIEEGFNVAKEIKL